MPAAGKGTRMVSVTGGLPKELLEVGGRPVLARVLEEARSAGVDGVVVVNSRAKAEVDEVLGLWSRTQFADLPIRVAYQEEARGLAHAVAAAGVDDDVIVMVGDVVFRGGSPCERMANLIFRGIDGCVAVEQVAEAQMHLYGIVELDDMTGSITRILEKPRPGDTKSRWAVASRWAFSRMAMELINDYCQNPARLAMPKEINLTETINLAIEQGMEFKAAALQPAQERVDCGSAEEYLAAKRLQWE